MNTRSAQAGTFRALVVDASPEHAAQIRNIREQDLPAGDVLIRVEYSSLNYKDGLACSPKGRIVKSYPFIPGIDLAGSVQSSSDGRFRPGDPVLVTGYELGVSHFGGFSEYARVPAEWVVPLPDGLTPLRAMMLGTAGLTAALSIHRLEQHGITPQSGPILVTGASGGVGSLAVAMLSRRGYEVHALTGKSDAHDELRRLGAGTIIPREQFLPAERRPLHSARWAGAIDPVGGEFLAYALSSLQYGGAAAVSGMTGGSELPASVFPFILRGVSLLGIDSVYCPMPLRRALWQRMADDTAGSDWLENTAQLIALDEVPEYASRILRGAVRGRTAIRLT